MKFHVIAISMLLIALAPEVAHPQSSSVPTWTQLAPTGAPPSARFSPGAVLDSTSNRLVIFGGQDSEGSDMNDLWILSNSDGLGGIPQWANIIPNGAPNSPPVRWGASAVYDKNNNRMIIFAGCNGGCLPTLNDVWVLTNANGLGGTPAWMQLGPTGGPPSGRTRQAAVYDSGTNRMIVFAGQNGGGFGCSTFSDVWVLTNANGLGGTPEWMQLSPIGGFPSGQYGASAIFNAGSNMMTVFGGSGFVNGRCTESNAVWVLENADGVGGIPTWVNAIAENSAASPPPRAFHTATYDASANRMTIFGGNNDTGVLGDTWVLDNADGSAGTPVWQQVNATGATPPRTGHVAGFNTSGRITVFAGHSGTCCLNDTWVLGNENGATQTVTSTSIKSSANPSVVGQDVALTATVTPSSGPGTPTGSVSFVEGATTLASLPLSSSGQVTFGTTALVVGGHTISAIYGGDSTFNGSSSSLTQQVSYGICVLYDQTRSVKSGATFPIKVQLCDVNGNDISSSAIVLHAAHLTGVSDFSGTPISPGNANADADFRFDTMLGLTGGYIFNLSTSGLASGTYSLQFTATGDLVTHSVSFGVK